MLEALFPSVLCDVGRFRALAHLSDLNGLDAASSKVGSGEAWDVRLMVETFIYQKHLAVARRWTNRRRVHNV
jgi:hypothetical protein